jgi:mannose-6-phosphate isomerase
LKGQYGERDIGLLFIFLLNYVKMSRDDAVVITPNVPHAYLTGDLVECMANSDNVVRGGLTPKLKDKETLYHMLPYHTVEEHKDIGPVKPSNVVEGLQLYQTGFEEFRVFKLQLT